MINSSISRSPSRSKDIRMSKAEYVFFELSCIHALFHIEDLYFIAVHVWLCNCTPSLQWMFDYLSPPPEDGAARKRAATSSTALPPSQLQVLLVEKSTELQDSTSS